ncbi:RIP metalloprotease RseP [Novosphingobium mangrovi (ex Huang et al. 2023)]|uniref:Zinc metalloprotease n=1 Tax=Novosphingobium mangrovi (ex Huang et al. 2023) TaxID=2976432 RepID=A0ABT2I706_9SPHN|nr:RIP metalloprotease RseP [Novosphingobium mangrovi (ex Huang et al. 2023)]MCT2400583.1 RIP metalloprotease RseP [Novosphingobium mangrovi (ex Huang et al. 2023)]
MTGSPNLLTTIFAFLLVLGPLVLIHELGHYLVGRLFGVKADAFSIGFGKEIAGWTDKRGTRWKLSTLPLGGYVQFAGDMNPASAPSAAEDGLTPEERSHTFHVKPLWQRALIVLAGPATNFLLCVAILAAFSFANGRLVADPEVADFTENSAAKAAGMEIGDRIVAIDGDKIDSVTDIPEHVVYFGGKTVSVTVKRDGRTLDLPVTIASEEVSDEFGNTANVGELGVDFAAPVVGGFVGESPAKAAGMKVGDRIVAVGDADVRSFRNIPDLIRPSPGQQVTITVLRDGEARVFPVTIGKAFEEGQDGGRKTIGVIGIRGGYGHVVPVGPVEAVGLGVSRSFAIMGTMVTGIRQIFTGDRSVRELGGPIKIAKYSGEQFSLGWEAFVGFVALISINLAFINLLPIPGLDGGHLAFYAAEMVRRRPLDVRSQEWAIRTGVALVLALMLFVTVNDLVSLPIFGG